ncbi:MAG: 30S ribosomal protein S18 [Phycisphaerae bacterium]
MAFNKDRQGPGGGAGAKRKMQAREPSKCRFCREKLDEIDYKDVAGLQRMLSSQGKMLTRKRTGNCALHQRLARESIKRARFIGLLPFVAQ